MTLLSCSKAEGLSVTHTKIFCDIVMGSLLTDLVWVPWSVPWTIDGGRLWSYGPDPCIWIPPVWLSHTRASVCSEAGRTAGTSPDTPWRSSWSKGCGMDSSSSLSIRFYSLPLCRLPGCPGSICAVVRLGRRTPSAGCVWRLFHPDLHIPEITNNSKLYLEICRQNYQIIYAQTFSSFPASSSPYQLSWHLNPESCELP